MLPFQPESIESMKARYLQAILETWLASEKMKVTPGESRTHIFDFEDGMRLIISKDTLHPNQEGVIHFSMSITNEWKKPVNENLLKEAVKRFKDISNYTDEPEFLMFSPEKGVPH